MPNTVKEYQEIEERNKTSQNTVGKGINKQEKRKKLNIIFTVKLPSPAI